MREEQNTYPPPPITGYRTLTQPEVDMMNRLKEKGDELGALIALMEQIPSLDQRWVAIGKTDAQKAIMALVRAVAKPTNF